MFGRILLFSFILPFCICKINNKYMEPLGRYKCPPNNVLVMYEMHLPYAIYMQCLQIPVCDETLSCSAMKGECPFAKVSGLSFMRQVHEYKKYDNLPVKGCCTYNPKPDAYDSTECADFQVTDILKPAGKRIVEATPRRRPPRKTKPKPTNPNRRPSNRKRRPSPKRRRPSPKRRQPSPKRSQPSPKRRQPSPKRRQPSPKRRQPSPKRRQPSPKRRQPSPKRRQPSPKRRQPSPKRRQPSPKRRKPSRRRPNQRKPTNRRQPNNPKQQKAPKEARQKPSTRKEDKNKPKTPPNKLAAKDLMRLMRKKFAMQRRMQLRRSKGRRRTRSKRGIDVAMMGLAEIAIHEIVKPTMNILIVNDIKRIEKGYKVHACTLSCTTTTTTRQPTTEKPRNRPRKQRKRKQKGPDYKDPLESPKSKSLPLPKRYRNRAKPKAPTPKKLNLGTFNLPSIPGLSGMAAPCFAGDSTVDTPNGPKAMNDVGNHELVKVSSLENGGPIYQPIEMWYHRIPDRQEQFIIINTTLSQNSLSLTPNHLIPLLDCQSINNFNSDRLALLVDKQSKFASTAIVGQCVIVLKDGHFVAEPITSVGRQIKTGIYSPITAQGSLVVNGIHVSCFTTLQNHQAQHTLHEFMMKFYHLLEYVTGIELGYDREIVHIPTPMKIVLDLANMMLPETMF